MKIPNIPFRHLKMKVNLLVELSKRTPVINECGKETEDGRVKREKRDEPPCL